MTQDTLNQDDLDGCTSKSGTWTPTGSSRCPPPRDQPMTRLIAESSTNTVRVRTPDASRLTAAKAGDHVTVRRLDETVFEIEGRSSEEIGTTASREGVILHELAVQAASLEDAYLALTHDEVQHRANRAERIEPGDPNNPDDPTDEHSDEQGHAA